MKKKILLITLITILISCDFDQLNNIQDTFTLTVNSKAVISKIDVRMLNANGGKEITSDITIEFSGIAANKIYTVNGKKDFKLDNGFITVGLEKGTVVDANNPLEATLTIFGDGFVTKEQSIFFDGTPNRSIDIALLEINNLPDGITMQTYTQNLVEGKTTEDLTITIPSENNTNNEVEIFIEKGTPVEDENGNLITDNQILLDITTYDNEKYTDIDKNPALIFNPISEFPGGVVVDNAVEAKTKNYKNSASSKSYNLSSNISRAFRRIGTRSQYPLPKIYTVNIPSDLFNPETNENVKAGDNIYFFFFTKKGEVRGKATRTIEGNPFRGNLFVKLFTSLDAAISMGYQYNTKHSCINLNNIKFLNNGVKTKYEYTITYKLNPSKIIGKGALNFENEYILNAKNLVEEDNNAFGYLGEGMVLTVKYFSYDENKYITVYEKEVSVCDLVNTTIDLTNKDCFKEQNVDLKIDCPDANYVLDNYGVYFKKEKDTEFRFYSSIVNSKLVGKTPCLESGTKYVFRFYYDGWKTSLPITEEELINFEDNFDMNKICEVIDNF